MFEQARQLALRWLRVPAEPKPPTGAPGSVRTFRAGRNYFKLRLAGWIFGQVSAVIGICFSLWFINKIEREVDELKVRQAKQQVQAQAAAKAKAAAEKAVAENPAAPTAPTTEAAVKPTETPKPAATATDKKSRSRNREAWKDRTRNSLAYLFSKKGDWIFPAIKVFELVAIVGFLLQLPFTYSMVRLEFEQHWYIVTDRSLRIRTGLWQLQESTMSFANLQQVEVHQGPLQRLLGLSDLRVQSAGGGGDYDPHHGGGESLHRGVFHCIENANDVRDLILERLRLFRAAGLGDPDEPMHAPAPTGATPAPTPGDALAAASELLAEARALRQALS